MQQAPTSCCADLPTTCHARDQAAGTAADGVACPPPLLPSHGPATACTAEQQALQKRTFNKADIHLPPAAQVCIGEVWMLLPM
jgi:hypothetical protein